MDLKQLREKGGFTSSTPVVKEVSWTHKLNGAEEDTTDTFTIHVKKLSFGAIERLLNDKDADKQQMAAFIADTILLGDDGKGRLTYKDAFQLEPSLARVLMEAISAVNGTGSSAAEKN